MTRLEQLRVDALLTPEDLAEKTGVSARTIRRLEARQGKATIATLAPLATFFSVPASTLTGPACEHSEAAA